MREKLDQRFDFSLKFLIAVFGTVLGKFENVRRVFWYRRMRISERPTCLALFGTTRWRVEKTASDATNETVLVRKSR
jgi:hypothetical protein